MSDSTERASVDRRRQGRLGLVLIVLGIGAILWGVFHILESVPKPEQLDFAHRTTDFQARSAVHDSFFGGFARALAGLVLALVGGRLRSRAGSAS
jgi:hypothetical protein